MFQFSIIGILIAVVIFFVLRELWCWYFKVNKALALLERIDRNTRKEGDDGKIHVKNVISKSSDKPDPDAKTSLLDPRLNVKW